MRRHRRLALAAAALGLSLAAAGCGYINPVQTHEFYQAADGTNVNLEQDGRLAVGARNMIVVIGEEGEATLFGSLANYTKDEVAVELEGTADGAVAFAGRASVPAEGTLQLGPGPDQHQVQIGALDVEPGSVMELTVSSLGQGATVTLPVTDTSLEYYQETGASDGGQG